MYHTYNLIAFTGIIRCINVTHVLCKTQYFYKTKSENTLSNAQFFALSIMRINSTKITTVF
jgi:hypothetical protein